MKTVSFKKNSAGTQNDFDAISVIEKPFKEKRQYSDINLTQRQITIAEYKEFQVEFGFLDEAQQTYLNELKEEDAPQFIYNSTTYDVRVVSLTVRANGGKAVVRKTVKE